MKFVKHNQFWWEWDDKISTLENAHITIPNYGIFIVDATKLEVVEVDGWDDLNWYGTKLYDDKYDTGWLDRSGKFYGCDYECHDEQAEFVHKLTEEDLERKGFIKITRDPSLNSLIAYFSGDTYDEDMKPTKAQMKYMSEIEKSKNCIIWFVHTSDLLDDGMEPSN